MKDKIKFFQWAAVLVLTQPLTAVAHPLHWVSESVGFLQGFSHPFASLEHVLIMLLLGLGVERTWKHEIYVMPLLLPVLMLVGGGLVFVPVALPYAESFVALSALMLVLLAAMGRRMRSFPRLLIISGVAVLHGYGHGYDMWLDTDAVGYTVGFLSAAGFLIAVAIAVKMLLARIDLKGCLGPVNAGWNDVPPSHGLQTGDFIYPRYKDALRKSVFPN